MNTIVKTLVGRNQLGLTIFFTAACFGFVAFSQEILYLNYTEYTPPKFAQRDSEAPGGFCNPFFQLDTDVSVEYTRTAPSISYEHNDLFIGEEGVDYVAVTVTAAQVKIQTGAIETWTCPLGFNVSWQRSRSQPIYEYFKSGTEGTVGYVPVPEPQVWSAACGIALLGFGIWRQRKN